MIKKLTFDQIITIVNTSPEQDIFDWKRDLNFGSDKFDLTKKSEFVKDIVAIANSTTTESGFIFYGIEVTESIEIYGLTKSYDDATFQQIVSGKVEPKVEFIYYEVSNDSKIIGVIHIPPSDKRPHIVTTNYGKLHVGQILIREGSSTRGINQSDLFECFYGEHSPYFANIMTKYKVHNEEIKARTDFSRELREQKNDIIRQMEITAGLPPGSLGSR